MLLALISTFISCSKAQIIPAENNLASISGEVSEEIVKLIYNQAKVFPNGTELSIAILKNSVPYFYGIKRENDTLNTVSNATSVFEIGSITKTFTATLLADFVINKTVNLDDPIQEYLEVPLKIQEPITLQQLANHTSGLPRLPSNLSLLKLTSSNPYKDYDQMLLYEYLSEKIKLDHDPNSKVAYSNLGAGLLGFILAKKERSTYNTLLKDKIFDKYNMTNSSTIKKDIEDRLVLGRDKKGKLTSNWDFDALAGGGAIKSSVEDMSKYGLAQFDSANVILKLTRKPTFSVSKNTNIGLGWFLVEKENNNPLLFHNGGTGGYTSSMVLDTNKKNGVIILSNVSAFSKSMGNIDNLAFEILKTIPKSKTN